MKTAVHRGRARANETDDASRQVLLILFECPVIRRVQPAQQHCMTEPRVRYVCVRLA